MLSLAPAYFLVGSIFFIIIDDVSHSDEFLVILPYLICFILWFLLTLDTLGFLSSIASKVVVSVRTANGSNQGKGVSLKEKNR